MLIKEAVPKIQLPNVNLHGHVCIDLHNHKSGFTERVETDNVVNNEFLQMYYNEVCLNSRIYNIRVTHLCGLPYYGTGIQSDTTMRFEYIDLTTFFRCLMLFKNPINKEDADFTVPFSSNCIGIADTTSRPGTIGSGSYNVLESKVDKNLLRRVWDFSTSQCNSKISSLGMQAGWYASLATLDKIETINKNTPYFKFIDKNTKAIYFYDIADKNAPFQKIDNYLFDKVTFITNTPTKIDGTVDSGMRVLDALPGALQTYFDATGSAHYVYITRWDYSKIEGYIGTLSVSGGSFNILKKDFSFTNSISTSISYPNNNIWLKDENTIIFWLVSNSTFYIYKLSLQDGAITEIYKENLMNTYWDAYECVSADGVLYLSGNSSSLKKRYKIDNSLNVTDDVNIALIGSSNRDDRYPQYYLTIIPHNGNTPVIYNNYMGNNYSMMTKANIEPVTKTASQSMKITYTITAE